MTRPASLGPPGRAFEAVGDGGPRDMVVADHSACGAVGTEPGLRATRDPTFHGAFTGLEAQLDDPVPNPCIVSGYATWFTSRPCPWVGTCLDAIPEQG